MYVEAAFWRETHRNEQERMILRTASAMHPNWVFCRESAALAHGLYVSWSRLSKLHVAQNNAQRSGSTAQTLWHRVMDTVPEHVDGIRVTPLVQTAADCMRALPFGESLAVADSALRTLGEDRSSFVEAIHGFVLGKRGAQKAVAVARHANPLSESGGESIARSIVLQEGFELPRLQVELPNLSNPDWPYRTDMLWRGTRRWPVDGELDGYEKYKNSAMTQGRELDELLFRQRIRDSRASLEGVTVMRFEFSDLTHPERFVALLERFGIPRSEKPVRLP